jgi:hypothetical protein
VTATAVVAAVVLLALASASLLTRTRLASTNARVNASRIEVPVAPGGTFCQGPEYVPEHAETVRAFVRREGAPAPVDLRFTLESPGTLVEWTYAGAPTSTIEMSIPPRPSSTDTWRLCIVNKDDATVFFAGNLTPLNPDAPIGPNGFDRRDEDEVRVDFLRREPVSLLAMAGEIGDHFARVVKPTFVRPWMLWALLAAVVTVIAFAVRTVWRVSTGAIATSGRLPRAAVWCFGLTFAHAAAWAFLTPAYQVPDELVHTQYAQYLGAYGRFPVPDPDALDRDFRSDRQDEQETLFRAVPFSAEGKPNWSRWNDLELDRRIERDLAPASSAGARNAASNPPLYYAYQSLVAKAVLPLRAENRLLVMRLASALLAGTTALLAFSFVREALPSSPTAAVASALAVGFHPLIGFLGGGVNNDNLLICLGTGLFLVVARCFRRGLTPARGAAVGAIIAAGLLTKSRMALLVPVAAAGLVWLAVVAKRGQRRQAIFGLASAAAVGLGIQKAWELLATHVFHRTAMTSSVASQANTSGKAIDQMLSYAWQYFFPRLWFMADQFPAWPQYGVWEVYVQGFVGRFGWFQYSFPESVNYLGLVVMVGLVALAAVELRRARARVASRYVELLTYVGLLLSSLFFLAIVGYRYRADTGFNLEQTRYLFPCIAVYAGVVALAVRGARGHQAAMAGGLVTLFGGHTLAAMFLTVARYYA